MWFCRGGSRAGAGPAHASRVGVLERGLHGRAAAGRQQQQQRSAGAMRRADPLHTAWILEAIRKIRRQKQRPSEDRICHAVGVARGLERPDVLHALSLAVQDGAVLRVTSKGCTSYKDPGGGAATGAVTTGGGTEAGLGAGGARTSSSRVPPTATVTAPAIPKAERAPGTVADLRQVDWNGLLRRAMEGLAAPGGSSFRNMERYLRAQPDLASVLANPRFQHRLRLAAKRAVSTGRLLKDGPRYRLSPPGGAVARGALRSNATLPATLLPHERNQVRSRLPLCVCV